MLNICLYKRECYKQCSTENDSEKLKLNLMLVKNAGWKPTRTMFAMSNTYLHLFIVNDKEPEDFPFWNIFVSSVKNYKNNSSYEIKKKWYIQNFMKYQTLCLHTVSFSNRTIFLRQISVLVESCSSEIGGIKRLPNKRFWTRCQKTIYCVCGFWFCGNEIWTPWKYFVSLGILYWNKIQSIRCYFFVLLNGSHKYNWIGIDVLFHVKISFIEKPKKWTTEKTSAIKFGYFSLSTKYAATSKLQFDEHLFIY